MKLLVISLCISIYAEAQLIVCPPDYCATVQCARIESCPEGYVLKSGGFCGCCPTCYKILGVGEICASPFIGGPPLDVDCGKDLVCINSTCQRQSQLPKNE